MSITTLHLRLHLALTPTPTRSNIAAKVNSDSGSRVPIRLSIGWIKSPGASTVLRSVLWPRAPGSAQRAGARRRSRWDAGSSAASTAFASMWSDNLLKDEQFRDNPVNPDFRERDPP